MSRKFCILNCDTTDEVKILNFFKEFSEYFCVGASSEYDLSLNLVLKESPDLIFIDIDQYSGNTIETPFGLVNELYQYLDYLPTLIAISSSTEKAYNVIKLGFYDYLLKPLSELHLRRCLLRLNKSFKQTFPQKICIKSFSDHQFIDLNCILYLKADNNTTDFFLKDHSKIAGFETLKYYENILPKYFMRVHNSYMVNTNFLVRINFAKSNIRLLGNDTKIPFSRVHKENVKMLKEALCTLSVV
jgi:DNA-binding LytR/AlgR family response regulator